MLEGKRIVMLVEKDTVYFQINLIPMMLGVKHMLRQIGPMPIYLR